MSHNALYHRPWRMQPDNFTPPARTPWGGRRILTKYKAGLSLGAEQAAFSVVGESWEVSVEPSFPSRVIHEGATPTLAELLGGDLVASLGGPVAAQAHGLPILVKLLDSAAPLSVQVHPSDSYCELSPTQSGKPESWFITDHDPGAGIYLGFRSGVGRGQVEAALSSGSDLEPLLNFVPVRRGDVFEIEAGTVHAIGPGVTLIEPQAVLPGREGVTYRFWDWNRRYDDQGVLSPEGKPRMLHVKHSLAVTRFNDGRGESFVRSTRRTGRPLAGTGTATYLSSIDNRTYRAGWLRGTGQIHLNAQSLLAVVVTQGEIVVSGRGSHSPERFKRGESFVLPFAAVAATELNLADCEAVVTEPVAL